MFKVQITNIIILPQQRHYYISCSSYCQCSLCNVTIYRIILLMWNACVSAIVELLTLKWKCEGRRYTVTENGISKSKLRENVGVGVGVGWWLSK